MMPGSMADPLRAWRITGVVATAVIVLLVPLSLVKQQRGGARAQPATGDPAFVGREVCAGCHREVNERWCGSDHDLAMDVATAATVLGDFDDVHFDDGIVSARFFTRDGSFMVATQGPDGEVHDYEIAYTFGFDPLQQYLIPFPGGRLQCLTIAWDTRRNQWFNLYPGRQIPVDDWLHWSRAAQNWNGMCAECHSTNLRKGYDPDTESFETTWSEIDVSCEACHGPGSDHVAWARLPAMARPALDDAGLVVRTANLDARAQVELCAPCHSRRSALGDYDHTGSTLLESLAPALLDEGLYHADGQILEEVYVYGSFIQSKMYRNEVRCSDCHDVHSLKLREQGNKLCLQCHRGDVYDSRSHHFHKQVHEGKPSDGALCVKCHMPEQPYMVVDWRADHSLRVPRPDLTQQLSVPNACSQPGCHDDRPLSWLLEADQRWYGRARKPHYGTILAAGREGRPEAAADLARLAGDPLYQPIVRATALRYLAAYQGEPAISAVPLALTDDEALLRYTAVMHLSTSEPGRLVELLAPLLEDPVRGVRIQAAARLAGIPGELFKGYQRQALALALDEYQAAMRYSLDYAFAGHNLGNLYASLGDAQRAIAYYRTAIEIDDLFIPPKVNLATLLNSQGRNDEALTLLREATAAAPEQADISYSLGLLLAEMGRLDEAAEVLTRAAAGLPEHSRVHYNLGLVLQLLQRIEEAEAPLLKAFALSPDDADVLHALVDHYLRRGDPARAEPYARRLAERHPDHPAAAQLLAYINAR
jgi:predicted CXXCH cytochrome family protein